jgi:hypothetical protein
MNEEFRKIIKLASKSAPKFYNSIRGLNNNAGHFSGIIEQQHPEIWKVPQKNYALSFIFKVVSSLGLNPTEYKLLINIIGHTWNFGKASEFISRNHFLEGKYNSNTEECLVGPSNVSPSSLSSSLDGLVEKGAIKRITIAHPSGPKTLYSPNPTIGGEFPYKIDPRERKWGHSNYPKLIQEGIDMIQSPLTWAEIDYEIIFCDLFDTLIAKLKHIELVPLFLDQSKTELPYIAERRNKWKTEIDKILIPEKNSKESFKLKSNTNAKQLHSLIEEALDNINIEEQEWLEIDFVQDKISHSHRIREQLDTPLALPLNNEDALLQAQLLRLRWGDTLLALSVDAWNRFENLVQEFGMKFPLEWKEFIEKHNNMKKEREKIPWIKKSTTQYFKNKSVLKANKKDSKSLNKPIIGVLPIQDKKSLANH